MHKDRSVQTIEFNDDGSLAHVTCSWHYMHTHTHALIYTSIETLTTMVFSHRHRHHCCCCWTRSPALGGGGGASGGGDQDFHHLPSSCGLLMLGVWAEATGCKRTWPTSNGFASASCSVVGRWISCMESYFEQHYPTTTTTVLSSTTTSTIPTTTHLVMTERMQLYVTRLLEDVRQRLLGFARLCVDIHGGGRGGRGDRGDVSGGGSSGRGRRMGRCASRGDGSITRCIVRGVDGR